MTNVQNNLPVIDRETLGIFPGKPKKSSDRIHERLPEYCYPAVFPARQRIWRLVAWGRYPGSSENLCRLPGPWALTFRPSDCNDKVIRTYRCGGSTGIKPVSRLTWAEEQRPSTPM